MKKCIISLLLSVILMIGILPFPAAAAEGLSNFSSVHAYTEGQFKDVSSGKWYSEYVIKAYEYGLINGVSTSTFAPEYNLQISEAIKLAACLHSIYHTGKADFSASSPWYQTYVDYALSNNIIASGYQSYTTTATRAEFAVILANALPDEALPVINSVEDNSIPDVAISNSSGSAIYKLYRAGILTGNDSIGTYNPNGFIMRQEVAAIVTRMADTGLRKSITLSATLSPEDLFKKCSPAVFYIEIYNAAGTATSSGSGFFLSSTGLAVTNYHVISSAASAKIKTSTGETYSVAGVYDYSVEYDLALLQIDGSNFSYLNPGDSSAVLTGATVYAIGSPLGLDNTLSQGIVSSAKRTIDGINYIQITAAISSGSSGGVLLNTYGQVIGVTSATYVSGQNLNLAVPINLIQDLSRAQYVPLSSLPSQNTNASLTVSAGSVSLSSGSHTDITVTHNQSAAISVQYEIEDTSIVLCGWGDWSSDGYSLPLTIYAVSPGTTTIQVELLDENDTLLTSKTVTVTVSQGAATQYYSNYYPIPDFGAFVGVPLYYQYNSTEDGTIDLLYKSDDIEESSSLYAALAAYLELLYLNGFEQTDSFTDDSGFEVLVLDNYQYGYSVFLGTGYYYGNECLRIMIVYE